MTAMSLPSIRLPVLYQIRIPSPRSAESTGRERIRLLPDQVVVGPVEGKFRTAFSITLFSTT